MNRAYLYLLVLLFVATACIVPAAVPTATRGPKMAVATNPAVAEKEINATVTAYQSLHVRSAPGPRAIVLGYLYYDNTVTLTGRCSEEPQGWAEILWEDGRAWVNADYLSTDACKEEQ